jgi:hypothetical protein
MGAGVFKFNETGSAAIAHTATVPTSFHYKLISVSLNLSTAPVASEQYTIMLDSKVGAAYDTLLYSVDLAAGNTSDVVWLPDWEITLEPGDAITVAFPNTDGRTYGSQITMATSRR